MKIGKNQYLLCPKGNDVKLTFASKIDISGYELFLGDHTEYIFVENNSKKVLVIGYVINADDPQLNQREMCMGLLSSLDHNNSNIGDLTYYWGGRYVIVVFDNNDTVILTDTCGMRSAYYYNGFLSSQARYIAEIIDEVVDSDANNYILKAIKADKEYAWPLDRTNYKSIRRLLPNHMVRTGHIERIIVNQNSQNLTEDKLTQEVIRLLQNAVKSAASLKPLAITLTAGWDSRIVMAAALPNIDKYQFVTLQYNHIPESYMDIQIPLSLCKTYKAKHNLLKCSQENHNFYHEYMEHSENGHKYWVQMTQSIMDYGYENYLWTKGACNEIGRYSSGRLYNWQVNGKILSKLYGIVTDPFSCSAIKEWLPGAKEYSKITGYSVLDLFYWEHRLGSWLSECLNEADVVGDTFSPFNIRAYFDIVKKVPSSNRIAPNYKFFANVLKVSGLDTNIGINPGRYDSLLPRMKLLMKNKLNIIYGLILFITKSK